MAQDYTFTPDRLSVDLSKAPPLTDVQAWKKWENESTSFDQVAESVTAQRIGIFNEMKTSGAPDAEIYKAILSFNSSLPLDYQIKSGFLKNLDTYA